MSKVILVDFDDADRGNLAERGYASDLLKIGAGAGPGETVSLPGDGEAFFVLVSSQPGTEPAVFPADLREALEKAVDRGGLVVYFLNQTDPARLASAVGDFVPSPLDEVSRPESIVFSPKALFHVPFERFRPFLRMAYKIAPEPLKEGEWESVRTGRPALEVFAKSADGFPVSGLIRKGKGTLWLLPSFGPRNIDIVGFILKNRSFMDTLSEGGPAPHWLDDDEYSFPEVKALSLKKDEELRRHEQAMAELDRLMDEEKKRSQECFQNLLVADGPELKKAVLETFRYLGWARVIDVDEYWKNVIRDREEDIWLMEASNRPLEAGLRMEQLLMVVVRADKNWAGDDDFALIQKFKGRRMQEFGNTRMRAVLVGNYLSAQDPRQRKVPFSPVQIGEAVKDGNGLLSTWELFRAVKAEKEGRLTREAIREAIRNVNGLIEFPSDRP